MITAGVAVAVSEDAVVAAAAREGSAVMMASLVASALSFTSTFLEDLVSIPSVAAGIYTRD